METVKAMLILSQVLKMRNMSPHDTENQSNVCWANFMARDKADQPSPHSNAVQI